MAVNPNDNFIWGAGGAALTPEQIALQRAIIARKKTDTSPVGSWMEGAARVADALGDKFVDSRLTKAETANTAYDASLASPLADALAGGVAAYPSSVAAGGGSMAPAAVGEVNVAPEVRDGIVQTASSLGIDPVDLATAISYETGGTFDPTKSGPTTQWGQHRGLIQFGEPQAKQYGVDWNNPVGSQLGPNGAVANYLRDRGVKPGMGMMDIYSTINAGAPGKYNASDAGNGGAAGTVADKVNSQMAGHRAKALALFGGGQPSAPVQTASLDPSVGMATAYAPQTAAVPPAAAAIEAVAPTQQIGIPMPGEPGSGLTPEQAAQIQVAADPTGQTTVASAMKAVPQNPNGINASMPAGSPGEIRQGPDGKSYQYVQTTGMAGDQGGNGWIPVNGGAPMAQPPADVSRVPALSAANGLPVVGPTGEPSAAPISGQARVAAALQAYPVQAQAAAGDKMVAGADQTLQPAVEGGAFPPAPVDGPAAAVAPQGNPIAAAVRAISDPRASPQTKAVAELVIKQAQAKQAAVAEQQVWQQRQAFEAQQQDNDPKRQLEIQKLQREVNAPAERKTITVNGTVLDAQTMQPVYTAPEKIPDSVRSLQLRAEAAGLKPGTKEYGDFLLNGDSKDTNVTVNTGEGNKFFNTLDEKNAGIFSGLSDTGIQAKSKLGMVTALEKRLETAPQGGIGALKAWAGELGVPFEGTDDIQAATALINRMVPEQRQPGSGTMSDADLALFKASLPRILNQPNGNKMIIGDLKSLSQYQIKMGEIADRVADRAMTPQEARDAIRALPNPLQGFLDRDNSEKMDQQDEGWKEIVPGAKVRKLSD